MDILIQVKCSHLIRAATELLTKVKINPFFWIVIASAFITGYFKEMIMIFTIVFIHELGHAVTARFFKWTIYKIELLPFGGVAEVEDTSNKPFHEELIVILAGPVQHLWMMVLSYYCIALPFWSTYDHQLFIWHNMMILLFNVLPILPLDGGRLLQLLFMYRFPYAQAITVMRNVSLFFLLVLCFIASVIYLSLHLWMILIFLLIIHYLEWKQRYYTFMKFILGKQSSSIFTKQANVHVSNLITVKEAVKLCKRGSSLTFNYFDPTVGKHVQLHEEIIRVAYLDRKRIHHRICDLTPAQF